MGDRVEELLTKGRSGRLSPAEIEELARLLVAPVLGPPGYPPAEFASKHVFPATDVAGRVWRVGWFTHVGEPLELDLTMPVERVGSWSEAAEGCRDVGWQNAQLEAVNQLTLWLHQHDRGNYQRWNECNARHREEVVTPLAESILLPHQRLHNLDDTFVQSVQLDILGALMENTYLSSGHRSFFFSELLWVYEAGHLPCGWRGEWPAGSLLVY
jgi:hypothetical protein